MAFLLGRLNGAITSAEWRSPIWLPQNDSVFSWSSRQIVAEVSATSATTIETHVHSALGIRISLVIRPSALVIFYPSRRRLTSAGTFFSAYHRRHLIWSNSKFTLSVSASKASRTGRFLT